jgi:P4 family phage/plasmid primase-like protien
MRSEDRSVSQETSHADDWLEGGQVFDSAIAPKHGWNNAADVAEAKRICRDIAGAALPGERGLRIIFDLAQRLRDRGISESLAADLIETICKPPFGKMEIADTVGEFYSSAATAPGYLTKAAPPSTDDDWIEERENDDWLEGGAAVWPKPILYDPKQHNAKLAEHFLAERPAKLIVSDGVIFTLDDARVWREISNIELAAEIRATDPMLQLDTPRVYGIIAAIELVCFTKARPFEWIDAPVDAPSANDLILFTNGILDFATSSLLPHSGRYFATALPTFKYDPAATCPTWDKCIGEWLDPTFHETLHEFIGYAMTPDTSLEKLLALIGARRGGKSTVLRVMTWLCGAAHVISRTLNDLGGEFGLEGALDSKLLIIPDAHDTALGKRNVALDRIKTITGNDEVSVNRKGLKIVTAKVPVRIAIAANRHPKFLDDSGALAARELVLIFERSFEGREDRDLSDKLRAELPGIANRALQGLARLRANAGKFTVGAKGRAAAREIAESQSPALRFARACLVITGDSADYLPVAPVFDAYEMWCSAESLGPRERRNRDDFKGDLVAALQSQGMRFGRKRWHDPARPKLGKGIIKRGFFGIRLKGR